MRSDADNVDERGEREKGGERERECEKGVGKRERGGERRG